ncbi:MAG: site-2 protease family protein [Verrucomicrobia bacterium]|nr:site-2 protease family protein [Verrucomicrobiota bacterium]
MLRWSINLFRIRGIQLALHGSFLLLLAYVAVDGWQDGGWEQMAWSVATLVAFFACVVLHELGHSLTAMRFGVGVRRILLMPIGGMAEFDRIPRQPVRELLITLAGPAVNFVIAAALWPLVGFGTGEYPANLTGFGQLLLHANLIMGSFNLLPVFPMDGGRILRALLAIRWSYLRATYWAATGGKILALLGAVVAVWRYESYLTAVLFVFILLAGEAEYQAVRRREQEDAAWRALFPDLEHSRPTSETG